MMKNHKNHPIKKGKILIYNTLPMQKGRDSNPRYGYPYTTFPGWPLQPLEHLSINFANI